MPTAQFRETGCLVEIKPNANLARFQVLGERSSGTNYVKRLLGRNTALTPTEALGWKHGFVQARAIPPDLLVVGVVRRADDWLRSMHAKPWHCTPERQALPFEAFIRAEWDTIVDRRRYFDGAQEAGELGQPLMQDRHPLTGEKFASLLDLRAAKLRALLSYRARACNFVLLRLEDVIADPSAILTRTALPGWEGRLRPIVKRLGRKFKPGIQDRPQTPHALKSTDWDWLHHTADMHLEDELGYSYPK